MIVIAYEFFTVLGFLNKTEYEHSIGYRYQFQLSNLRYLFFKT